jgi:hypothetical protein
VILLHGEEMLFSHGKEKGGVGGEREDVGAMIEAGV